MYTVHLHQLKFIAYHGLHDEEKILGNEFELNVDIHSRQYLIEADVSQYINYADAYAIIKKIMAVPTPLLEMVAIHIIDELKGISPMIDEIKVSIFKKYPPLTAIEGELGVTISKSFL